MTIESHLDSLKRKHGALEEKIANLSSRPMPDQSHLKVLKRDKLRLKEQIEKIASQTQH